MKSTPWYYRCSLIISALLDAFDWQLLTGLMLASLLLLTFPLTCYSTRVFPICPIAHHTLIQASCTSPQSNSAFLAPSEDLSPSLGQCYIIKHWADTMRTWWKLYSKLFLSVRELLFPCSLVCSCTCMSARTGDLTAVGIIVTCVLTHSLLFVRSAGFVLHLRNSGDIQWSHGF